jgi:hypothetical protein
VRHGQEWGAGNPGVGLKLGGVHPRGGLAVAPARYHKGMAEADPKPKRWWTKLVWAVPVLVPLAVLIINEIRSPDLEAGYKNHLIQLPPAVELARTQIRSKGSEIFSGLRLNSDDRHELEVLIGDISLSENKEKVARLDKWIDAEDAKLNAAREKHDTFARVLDTFRSRTGMVEVRIKNTGQEIAEGVTLEAPSGLAIRITRGDTQEENVGRSPYALGSLRGGEELTAVVWTELPASRLDAPAVRHNKGAGSMRDLNAGATYLEHIFSFTSFAVLSFIYLIFVVVVPGVRRSGNAEVVSPPEPPTPRRPRKSRKPPETPPTVEGPP